MATMLEQIEVVTAGLVPDPMLPMPYRIQRVKQETGDTFTLEILAEDSGKGFSFAPGQFNMLYVFGVGKCRSPSAATLTTLLCSSTPLAWSARSPRPCGSSSAATPWGFVVRLGAIGPYKKRPAGTS